MYEQLLIHLVGDYWLQNDWMAMNKKRNFGIALLHSFVYTLPFILVCKSVVALFVIMITHALIDGTRVVNFLNQLKNNDFDTHCMPFHLEYKNINSNLIHEAVNLRDGFGNRALCIRVWLTIIQDNILHLVINYLAIMYL